MIPHFEGSTVNSPNCILILYIVTTVFYSTLYLLNLLSIKTHAQIPQLLLIKPKTFTKIYKTSQNSNNRYSSAFHTFQITIYNVHRVSHDMTLWRVIFVEMLGFSPFAIFRFRNFNQSLQGKKIPLILSL